MSWAGEEANNAIGRSLSEWVNALPAEVEGQDVGILGDWMAVVSMVTVDDEECPRAEYYLAMKDGTLLPHVAEGLLAVAAKRLEDYLEDS